MKKKSPPRDLPSTDQPAKKASQPHDSLFKAAMRDPKVARDVIKANIPKFLDEMVLWDTLTLQHTNFVRDNLEQLHSDVVYLCQLNEGSYLYFLIEHVRDEGTHIKSIYHMARLYPNLCSHYLGASLATMGC